MKLISLSFQDRFRLYVLDPIRFAVDPYKLDLPDRMKMTEEEFELIDSLLPIRHAITGALLTMRFGPEWLKDEMVEILNGYLSVLMTMNYEYGLGILTGKQFPFGDEFWYMVEMGQAKPSEPEPDPEVDDYLLRVAVEKTADQYPIAEMPYQMKVWYEGSRLKYSQDQRKMSEVFMRRYDDVSKKMVTARKEGHESDNHWNNMHDEQQRIMNAWKEALLALK